MASLRLPPGFRFHPTDAELVEYYLFNKVQGRLGRDCVIIDVELLQHEPWDLPSLSSLDEGEWYFFCPRDRKYPNGSRANRATDRGYWKATGKDKQVISAARGRRVQVGMKKTLVFYQGRAPHGTRTDWVMHEYRLEAEGTTGRPRQGDFVLCRVFCKSAPTEPAEGGAATQEAATPVSKESAPANLAWGGQAAFPEESGLEDGVPPPATSWALANQEPKVELRDDEEEMSEVQVAGEEPQQQEVQQLDDMFTGHRHGELTDEFLDEFLLRHEEQGTGVHAVPGLALPPLPMELQAAGPSASVGATEEEDDWPWFQVETGFAAPASGPLAGSAGEVEEALDLDGELPDFEVTRELADIFEADGWEGFATLEALRGSDGAGGPAPEAMAPAGDGERRRPATHQHQGQGDGLHATRAAAMSRRSLDDDLRHALRSHGVAIDETDLSNENNRPTASPSTSGAPESSSVSSGSAAAARRGPGIMVRPRPANRRVMTSAVAAPGLLAAAAAPGSRRVRLQVMRDMDGEDDGRGASQQVFDGQMAGGVDPEAPPPLDGLVESSGLSADEAGHHIPPQAESSEQHREGPSSSEGPDRAGQASGPTIGGRPGAAPRSVMRRVVVGGGGAANVNVRAQAPAGAGAGAGAGAASTRGPGAAAGVGRALTPGLAPEGVMAVARGAGSLPPGASNAAAVAGSHSVPQQRNGPLVSQQQSRDARGSLPEGSNSAAAASRAGFVARAAGASASSASAPASSALDTVTDQSGAPQAAWQPEGVRHQLLPLAANRNAPVVATVMTLTNRNRAAMAPPSAARITSPSGTGQSADTSSHLHSVDTSSLSQSGQSTCSRARPIAEAIQENRRERQQQLQNFFQGSFDPIDDFESKQDFTNDAADGSGDDVVFLGSSDPRRSQQHEERDAFQDAIEFARQQRAIHRSRQRPPPRVISDALLWLLEGVPAKPAHAAELPSTPLKNKSATPSYDEMMGRSPPSGDLLYEEARSVPALLDVKGAKATGDEDSGFADSAALETSPSRRRLLIGPSHRSGVTPSRLFASFFAPLDAWGPLDWFIVGAVASFALSSAVRALGFA